MKQFITISIDNSFLNGRCLNRLKKSILPISLILLIQTQTGCKKYLDKEPDTQYAYPTTVVNIQAMFDHPQQMNEAMTPSYEEASADDYFINDAQLNGLYETSRQAYLWQFPRFSTSNDWRVPYGPIYIANIGIEEIDKIPVTAAEQLAWNNVKGSAYFFRAYYFLHLTWTNAKAYDEATAGTDLGIVLTKTSDINDPAAAVRSSVEGSYQRVIADAKIAALYLPNTPLHPLRPSKPAAYGLLARAYLSMRNYDSAFKYADLCLQLKSNLINYNGDADLVSSISGDNPFRKYNKETIFYTETSYTLEVFLPRNAYVDTALVAGYADNDLRKTAFFKGTGLYRSFKGSYTQSIDNMFSGIATDEILLTRAECYARNNNKDAALADLNQLLITRWKTGTFVQVTATTAAEALDKILLERRKELLMRDLRWMDIKRLNKEGRNITPKRIYNGQTYTLTPNDDKYALPIPKDIIQITGMPQNPGW